MIKRILHSAAFWGLMMGTVGFWVIKNYIEPWIIELITK